MIYEMLATIVVINALATVALWRQVSRKANRPLGPNKKGAEALWRSDPIVPRHDPPRTVGGEFPSLVDDVYRLFFADFNEFADVLNWWLADEFTQSPFRLQELPDSDVRLNVDLSAGPTLGRCFAIYHNQTKIGRLEVRPSHNYATENPDVYTSVWIEWPRLIGSYRLRELLEVVAMHVTRDCPTSVEHLATRQSIHYALTKALWDEYEISPYDRNLDEVEGWGEIDLSFYGVAEFYIQRKNAPGFPRKEVG